MSTHQNREPLAATYALEVMAKNVHEMLSQRDDARAMAALWKETARHLFGARSLVRLACDLETARADTAEKALVDAQEEVRTTDQIVLVERKLAAEAERDRDEARDDLRRALIARDKAVAEQPRPLTADDITDEMVERAWEVWCELPPRDMHSMRFAIRAALTEPTRPEGAERFDPIVDAAIRGHSDITSPAVVHAIADALAEEGVRAPGAES